VAIEGGAPGERDVEASVSRSCICALANGTWEEGKKHWPTETCRETGFKMLAEATARTLDAVHAADRYVPNLV